MITSRINLPIPGGWGKDAADQHQSEAGEGSVAAGVVSNAGDVVDEAGKTVAKITEGQPKDLVGNVVTATGDIVGKDGKIIGKAVPLGVGEENADEDRPAGTKGSGFNLMNSSRSGQNLVGGVTDGLGLKGTSEKDKDEDGSTEKAASESERKTDNIPNGTDVDHVKPKAREHAKDISQDEAQPEAEKAPEDDVVPAESKDKPIDLEDEPKPIGDDDQPAKTPELKDESKPIDDSELAKTADLDKDAVAPEEANIKDADKAGSVAESDPAIGVPKSDGQSQNLEDVKSTTTGQDETPLADPFERFPGAQVNEDGKVMFEDESIGVVAEGDIEKLAGKTVDAEGNIINETGTVLGKAELKEELQGTGNFAVLKGAKVNKGGNLVNDKGQAIGRITEGILKHLIGRKADENGEIWNDAGKVIGKAEPIPDTELEELKDLPFVDFPDATVGSGGKVIFGGETVGRLVDGDEKKLKGKKVDPDGDILDHNGNVVGKAERWEEEEAPPEPEADRSILAGKRVNKVGNIVDSHGQIFGRVIEGDPKRLAGRMCDKNGNILSESGDILGKGEVVPEGEREGFKEGPFSELPGCTVSKDGKVVTPSGDVVGRLTSGDPKVLFGRPVDEDGDILDRNGNSLGKAERWEEPVVEKAKNALSGRKVNREGNVVDANGDLIGKLTTGDLSICAGKEVDDDGDVVDSKGNTIGHVSLLADIPEPKPEEPKPEEPEPTESPEEKAKREEAEHDEKLAKQLAGAVQQCLDRIRPICKLITQKVEAADRKPKEELDEDALVKEVRPLIEEGNKILVEANGVIRALDPDGRIQNNAKSKAHTRDATPAEYHLADVLKELTGTVTECIDNAKKKIEDMPHAKKELNPLWGLMTEPLFQILAAVGLLLNGVLELVGRLLSGLGLGGIVNNLLGGLGLTNVLKSLGVGGVVTALTGQNKKK